MNFRRFLRREEKSLGPYIDTLMYFGGILGPLVTMPQLLQIYFTHNVEGISLFSWGSYLIGCLAWLVYGLIHRAGPIIFLNGMYLPIYIFILIGILMYQ